MGSVEKIREARCPICKAGAIVILRPGALVDEHHIHAFKCEAGHHLWHLTPYDQRDLLVAMGVDTE
jgi:hypothetical protein